MLRLQARLQRKAVHLPSQLTSFIGRFKEINEIIALLANPTCQLLTLVGSGGIGETGEKASSAPR